MSEAIEIDSFYTLAEEMKEIVEKLNEFTYANWIQDYVKFRMG